MGRYKRSAAKSTIVIQRLRIMMRNGMIEHKEYVLKRGQRLDKIAGMEYGDSNLWWVIAAVSGIGFAAQVPHGTIIKVPVNINELLSSIGV